MTARFSHPAQEPRTTARITFRAKARTVYHADGGTPAYDVLTVPAFTRAHCDMNAFRTSRKYGGYANSDMFTAMLARIRRDVFGGRGWLRLDQVPEGVTVDATGFLAIVTIDVQG